VKPIQPLVVDDADDVGEAPLAAATAFLHGDDARASLPALRLPERVLHRGPMRDCPASAGPFHWQARLYWISVGSLAAPTLPLIELPPSATWFARRRAERCNSMHRIDRYNWLAHLAK